MTGGMASIRGENVRYMEQILQAEVAADVGNGKKVEDRRSPISKLVTPLELVAQGG